MSERIKELAEQFNLEIDPSYPDHNQKVLVKFAELIVRECAVYCEGHMLPDGMAEENHLNYNAGVMDCAIGLRQHFGVE